MFPAVCHQFAHAMGRHTLIPSSSIDESTRLLPLNIVAKKKRRRWLFFHKVEYSSYDFPLQDLLIGRNVLESPIEKSKFCSYNPESTYSLNGKFGADILKDIMDASLSASDKVTISAKLGELTLLQVGSPDGFMSELMTRQLDMKHPLIKQIYKDRECVLCVIRGVVQTSDKAEIKRTDNTDGNIKVLEKIRGTVDVESGAATSTVRDIMVEPGTVLAYKVWELRINVTNGSIVPVMTSDLSGGFSSMDASSDGCFGVDVETDCESTSIKDLQDRLQPILDLTEADGQSFRSSLLKLMTCPRDVVVLSRLLSKAEEGDFKENADMLEKQFVNKHAVLTILKIAGLKTEEHDFVYKGETPPMFTAVAHVVDALAELESTDLENLCQCNQQQLNVLSEICQSAVTSSMPITIDAEKISQLVEPVSTLLTDLDFTVYTDDSTVLPPKTKTCVVECIFCVLYCLCGEV